MSNYIIYARKSTESEDRQVLSIDSQVKELKALAQSLGLEIGEILSEAQSAKAPGREVFSRLMKRAYQGQVKGIISWKLDRLARNPLDGGNLIWALEEKKIEEIVTPQRTFSNTGNDKFWMQLEFGMAKKYVDDLSDNVKRGNRAKLELGRSSCDQLAITSIREVAYQEKTRCSTGNITGERRADQGHVVGAVSAESPYRRQGGRAVSVGLGL
jgi:site-specific DNA recombinase